MPRSRSMLLVAAGVLAAIAVVTTLVLPWLMQVDSFRPELEARLSSALGRTVTLGTLRLSVWRGIELRSDSLKISGAASGATDAAPTLEARRVRVRVALLALLKRRMVARSFVLDDATLRAGSLTVASRLRVASRFDLTSDGAIRSSGSLTAKAEVLPGAPQVVADFTFQLRDGRLLVESGRAEIGPATIDVRGEISGARAGSMSARLQISGRIEESSCSATVEGGARDGSRRGRLDVTCPSLDLARIAVLTGGTSPVRGMALRQLVAACALEDGALRCADVTFEMYGGAQRASFSARPFEADFPFDVECHLAGVPVEALGAQRAPGQAATLRGNGDLDLALHGRAPGRRPDTTSLTGTARLSIRDGSLQSVGVLRQIGRLLESSGGRGIGPDDTPFQAMSATFRIQSGAARTDDLVVRSADLDLDGHGTAVLDGALDFDLLVSFSKDASAGLVERNSTLRIRVGPDGRLTVPLTMAGSLAAPELRLDVDRVLSEGVERILQDEKKGWLKKWLGGR